MEYELNLECSFKWATCEDWVIVPFISEMNMSGDRGFTARRFKIFLEMKFACDPQSSKTRHSLSEPSWSSTTAVESMTCLSPEELECVTTAEEGVIALAALSSPSLLPSRAVSVFAWSNVLSLHALQEPEVHLLATCVVERKQLAQSFRARISETLRAMGSAKKSFDKWNDHRCSNYVWNLGPRDRWPNASRVT